MAAATGDRRAQALAIPVPIVMLYMAKSGTSARPPAKNVRKYGAIRGSALSRSSIHRSTSRKKCWSRENHSATEPLTRGVTRRNVRGSKNCFKAMLSSYVLDV